MTQPPPQVANDDDDSEQRRYPRLACGGIADLRVIPSGGKETGTLVNLSKRGCCFLADRPLRGLEGSSIEIHLRVRGIDFRVAGILRHIHKGIRAGIEFVSLSDRKSNQIDELIAELTLLDLQAKKLRQEELKKQDEENVAQEERRQGQIKVQEHVKKRLLRFYRQM